MTLKTKDPSSVALKTNPSENRGVVIGAEGPGREFHSFQNLAAATPGLCSAGHGSPDFGRKCPACKFGKRCPRAFPSAASQRLLQAEHPGSTQKA